MAGIDITTDPPGLTPRLAPNWRWYGVRDLPFRGRRLTWFGIATPELTVYATEPFADRSTEVYPEDFSQRIQLSGGAVASIALARPGAFIVLLGNTSEHSIVAAFNVTKGPLGARYTTRVYNSLRNAWTSAAICTEKQLRSGMPFEINRKGFCAIECTEVRTDVRDA